MRSANSFWTTFRFLGLGHDVDVQRGQLAGQTHVLTATTDGKAQLLVRHHDLDPLGVFVQNNLADFGRLQRVHQEGRGVLVPWDDVDLFALQLVHHGLHARTTHTDTGTNRVDRIVIGNHCDLGARAWVTGHCLDLDDAIVDFGHFHLEQFGHEFRRGARQEDLRAAGLAAHILDVAADAVVRAVAFAANLFIAAQDGFASTHVHDDVAIFLRV